jgi:hypothetical protein
MNNNALKRLEIYAKQLTDRLSSPVPEKHKKRPEAFKEYLIWELDATKRKIDAIKLGTTRT